MTAFVCFFCQLALFCYTLFCRLKPRLRLINETQPMDATNVPAPIIALNQQPPISQDEDLVELQEVVAHVLQTERTPAGPPPAGPRYKYSLFPAQETDPVPRVGLTTSPLIPISSKPVVSRPQRAKPRSSKAAVASEPTQRNVTWDPMPGPSSHGPMPGPSSRGPMPGPSSRGRRPGVNTGTTVETPLEQSPRMEEGEGDAARAAGTLSPLFPAK